MANTNAKAQASHTDYQDNNNGGSVVAQYKGSTPAEKVGSKVAGEPDINKPVVEITLTSYENEPIGKLTP